MIFPVTKAGEAFWLSVLIGSFTGIILQVVLSTWGDPDPLPLSELWAVPLIIFGYGAFAIPFVALGLAVFGLPATALLRGRASSWWVGLVALIWGAFAGKLVFYAIDHVMFFGFYEFEKVRPLDMGVIYGAPTGIAWWLLRRRQLV